ncbi:MULTISPECIES: thioredoxin family protein [Chryseobacterium]|uniref:Thioredoxin 1 n=1 Tax=Chryseobacterium camelliae TaxID=1265445 RepID=A0ABU0TFN5_9FLAO|nr:MULTISPECIES: thioredoxin family protein [Chryseobacterium]MDT3406378.1 thioredoxin 1 [Pseudacidovorax intermedius]MDQ1095822.1 thioredoxin 1 [Chryseobacterium camelliae]MDQ1099759.1 thioredoxin 1 [Chryseobacterium sp. SORGH_AS_1048]MDR6087107.1 thioredoxin 1 [Chryseobacterium sp. SORGH_AS_0909]MDR6131480.1 thioredoxin 1 [Chryseobacterium sp. SORGH_AS_1175]
MKSLKSIIPLVLAFFLLTALGNTGIAQQMPNKKMETTAKEIKFSDGTWKDIAAMAKKNKKYVFVDAYTTWCGPCKLLKSHTFKEKEVATFFNKNFINVTVDMEKGEGLTLAQKWDVNSYPALLFFTPDGKLVMKQIGFVEGKKLIEIGKQSMAKI